jgi:hypothetical protein
MGVDPFTCDFPTLRIGGPMPRRRPVCPDGPATLTFLKVCDVVLDDVVTDDDVQTGDVPLAGVPVAESFTAIPAPRDPLSDTVPPTD